MAPTEPLAVHPAPHGPRQSPLYMECAACDRSRPYHRRNM
ncbi:MAG: hypothetical protein GF393_08860 [Armatimonadia bacterium]|nr:hypothetical protein [Armatimonadia bacterium]